MHQALYRKYRPQTFSDVCGQDHISNTLKTQVAENRFTHAYLFTGSRGTGKTSSAKILSKAVNCLHPVNGDPCNECENCVGIDNGEILDVVEIDAASNRGVDDIRNLREQIEYTPSRAKFRVYIIDEVHMLTKEAFNALLKTLEEPPAHAIFILATTEVWAIPPTILSRCQRYDFNRISVEVITARIKYICEKEDITIEDNAATLIAKLCDGGMRDALSLLDLCSGTDKNITEKLVADCAGLIGKEHLFKIVDVIENKDAAKAIELLDELYASSCDIERLFTELIAHYRDLLVAKTSKDFKRLITGTNEDINRIEEQSKKIRFESILYCSSKLSDALDKMKGGQNKRIVAETALIRLCTNELDSSSEAILKRISDLEDKIASGAFVQRQPSAVESEQNDDNGFLEETTLDTDNTLQNSDVKDNKPSEIKSHKAEISSEVVRFNKWPEVMEILQKESHLLYGVLNNSKAYTKGSLLLIDAPNSAFSETMRENKRFNDVIRNAVFKVTNVTYKLGPYNRTTAPKVQENDPLDNLISSLGEDITIEE